MKFLRMFLLLGGTFVLGLALGLSGRGLEVEVGPIVFFGVMSVGVAIASAVSDRFARPKENKV